MKKLTALILVLSMVLSLFGAMPVLADAESDRVAALNSRDEYYYPIEYNKDVFATFAEILEFGVFETTGYPFPVKDLEGNSLSESGNWLSKKGIDAYKPTDVKRRNFFFLIESVEGVSENLKAEAYKSPTDYTKTTITRTLTSFNINGNPNMELVKTDEDGTKHYMYNAGNVKYQMGPIGGTGAHRTADGGYNARALGQTETVTFARTQEHAENLSFMLAYEISGDANNALAGLEKVTVEYNDGKPAETKYIVVTTMQNVTGYTPKDGGDRFGRILVAVPKTKDGEALDHTSGDVLDANNVQFTTENVKTITGFDATLEDVVFPADFVVGESMPIADKVIASNPVASYGANTNPSGYANHYTFDFGEDVKEIIYKGNFTHALNYPGAIIKENFAYIPVTIKGASEDYAYYARFGRPCNYAIHLMGATSYAAPVQIKIDAVNAKIAEAETLAELEAIEAEIAQLVAEYDKVLESDFDISVIASKKAELARLEALRVRNSTRVDIIATAKAPSTGYSAHKIDMFKNAKTFGSNEAVGSVFYEGTKNVDLRLILNAFSLSFKAPSYFTKASAYGTTHTFNIEDEGYEIVATGTATGTRAVKTDGEWAKGEEETYETRYYKVPGDNGDYILGPVAVEDSDPATDVFLSENSIHIGRKVKDDRTGTKTENTNTNVFENINLSGDYLNVMLYTDTHEGDATLIPIKVTYTTGDPETYYAFVSKPKYTDRRLENMVYYLPKKADGTEYTQAEVVAGVKANKKLLTAANAETIGVSADATIRDISFVGKREDAKIIIPTKRIIGTWQNRNTGGNEAYRNYYAEDITVPLDSSRTVSSVTLTNWQDASQVDALVAPHNGNTGDTDYRKVTINGYEGEYDFFVYFGRTCQGCSALLGMSVTSISNSEKIEKINTQLNAAETKEEIIAALNAMKALVGGSNGAVLAKDFDTVSAVTRLSAFVSAEIEAAENMEDVEAIEAEVDGYVSAYGIDATALKTAITEKKAELDRVAGLITGERYTPVKLKVAEGKSAEGLVYGFEDPAYATMTNSEENAENYNIVKDKKYVTTRLLKAVNYAPQTVAQWQEYDKTHTGLKTGIQFYSKEMLDSNNKYTTPNGTEYVMNTFGDTDYNSAYLKYQTADNFVAEFDGVTPYNSVKLLLSAVDEPVWNGNERNARAVTATINYADGTSEKKLVFIGSLYGYGAALSAKLKESAEIRGLGLNTSLLANEKNINTAVDATGKYKTKEKISAIYTNLTSSNITAAGKTTWSPFDYAENIWAEGMFYSSAYANTGSNAGIQEDRKAYILKKMTDGAGHFTSVTLDTKGKAVKSVTIGAVANDSHFNELCGESGAFRYAGDTNSWYYRVPISDEAAKELLEGKTAPFGKLYKFDKTGAVETETQTVNGEDYQIAKAYSDYTVEDCDVYLTVHAAANAYFVVLHAATGEKKYANLMDYIKEAETEMVKITENSSMEDAAYAEDILNNVLADGKVKESDFDQEILTTFKANLAIVKGKANVSGTIEMTYVAGTKPVAAVTIRNLSALAGKPYKVIVACYDENENLLGTTVKDKVSTTAKTETFTVEAEELPEGTKMVKGFIWKDFASLTPLAESDEAEASNYALDNFFDIEKGEFKKSKGELNIVFIGDSLTQGATTYDGDDSALSDDQKKHWTKVVSDYFAEQTGRTVNMYNAGVGGTETSFVAKMVSQTAEDKNADIVFIENVNDLNTNTTNSQKWTENLVRNLAKLDKKPVVILAHAVSPFWLSDTDGNGTKTIAEGKEWQIQHINAKDVVAKAYNLASVDYVTYYYNNTNDFDKASKWMQEDYGPDKIATSDVHPQPAGYNRFGNYIVDQISANPSAYITRITPAEDVAVINSDIADVEFKLTYATNSRFTYDGFNLYTKANPLTGTTNDAEHLIEWKYNFPFGATAQAITTNNGASFEFVTEAKAIEIVHSCPYLANRRADFDIYVDNVLYGSYTTPNTYANVCNSTAVELDGQGSHKIKVEVKQDSTGVKNVFNFAYLVEQK